ncbi:MAG: SH3 domain-containing protein [Anaerolineae bacterium]|nr:SH3 domain-containing protein [Anaerolineae bacterium]
MASEVEEDFDFNFGDDVEEKLIPEQTLKKRDSGLLSRTDDLVEDDDFGDDTDWLSALDDAIEDDKEFIAPEPATVNVDDLLDSIDDLGDIKEDDDSMPIKTDLDNIFDEYDRVDDGLVEADVVEAADIPEWLRDAASGKSDAYAATKVIRDLEDRSLDGLDDRLLELHERGLELTSDLTDSETDRQRMAKVVPNIGEALIPAKVITTETSVISTEPQLSPQQHQRAEILRSIVGEAVASDDDEIAIRAAPRRRRLNLAIGRWVIAIILAAAVLVPFYSKDFNVSDPPAVTFNDDTSANSGLWAYQRINNLQPQETVLLAVEYGATGARELDLFTEGLLTHILHQGAIPVIVSSDAIGSLRAENIAARLSGEGGYNRDYYVVGYLPAGNLGLRDLAGNLATIVSNNSNGQPTNLTMRSLDEFKTIILIADGGETVRDWMEQIIPQTNTPFIIAISQSARPIAQSFVEAYSDDDDTSLPLMIGYADAVTYQSMLLSDYGLNSVDANVEETEATEPDTAVEVTESPEPTATTPSTATPEPTLEAIEDVEAVPVIDETEAVELTATAEESDTTVAPMNEPADEPVKEEATPTQEDIVATQISSTATSEPSSTPETVDEEEMVEIAIVVASGRVNVREGAGAGFNLVSTVAPNERLRVIGRNDANDWLQVVLSDGREAWIAAFLTEVEFVPASEADSLYRKDAVRFFRPPPRNFQQSETEAPTTTPESLVNVGRNASGTTIAVFDNADLDGTPIEDLPANSEFVVLQQSETISQILLIDGRTGWVETRLIRVDEVPLSASGFVATHTLTPTPSNTPTVTPTATNTSTPTVTPFAPDVFPEPIPDVEARWNAMTLGLLATILIIFVGNGYWIIRWLRRRGE